MTFLELFLICTLNDPKLAEKWTNLAENPKKSGSECTEKNPGSFEGKVYFFLIFRQIGPFFRQSWILERTIKK